MTFESDRIMFEVYRESGFSRRYCVVYFTELDDHNKDAEINAAMAGEHFYEGFIAAHQSGEAKRAIAAFLDRLNRGDAATADELEVLLVSFAPR